MAEQKNGRKIFYMDWQCYAGEDIFAALTRLKDPEGSPQRSYAIRFRIRRSGRIRSLSSGSGKRSGGRNRGLCSPLIITR